MLARRIITNTAYNAVGRVWLILVNLFLTPFILSYLGDQRFALWALFWSFSSWFAFMDLGMGVSVVREIAKLTIKDDSDNINKTLCSALIFNLIIGVSVTLLVWFASHGLIALLHVNANLKYDALTMMYFGPLAFIILGLMSIFDAFLRGMQRYDLITIVALVVSLINVLGVWIALHFGYGISGLLTATIFTYLIQMVFLIFFTKQLHAKLQIRIHFFDINRVREMIVFGFHLQTARLAELASYQADKLILAFLTPLYFVTTYDLGSKIASLLRQIPYLLTSAIFPAVAHLDATNDHDRLWLMYERGSKYLWMVSTPLLIGLCITAHLFIQSWLGYVSVEVYRAVLILGFGYWCVVNTAVAYNIAIGVGWSKPVMYISLLQAVLNLILSWVLAKEIGYIGVLYATSITLFSTNALFYIWFCHAFKREKLKDLRLFSRIMFANLLPACACLIYMTVAGLWVSKLSRIESIEYLMVSIIIYVAIYMLSIRLGHLLNKYDAELLGSHCPIWLRKYLFVE